MSFVIDEMSNSGNVELGLEKWDWFSFLFLLTLF